MGEELRLQPGDAAALRDFVRKIRSLLGAELIGLKLFGSKARGESAPDSDIDVVVVVKEGTTKIWDQVLDVAFDVNLAHDVYISPRVIDQNILKDPVWKITPFLQAVEREGVLL
jgi:predicted nucleotidyltransferase